MPESDGKLVRRVTETSPALLRVRVLRGGLALAMSAMFLMTALSAHGQADEEGRAEINRYRHSGLSATFITSVPRR